MAADAGELGRVRAEALFTERGAWFVCFPGHTSADRLISVKQTEQPLADTLLDLCRRLHARRPAVTKPELQAACRRAKNILRSGAELAAVLGEFLPAAGPEHIDAALCASADAACEAPAPRLQGPWRGRGRCLWERLWRSCWTTSWQLCGRCLLL